MKQLLLCAGIVIFAGNACTTRAAYDAVRTNQRNHCNELHETEREKCLAKVEDDYDTYSRKREEVRKSDE